MDVSQIDLRQGNWGYSLRPGAADNAEAAISAYVNLHSRYPRAALVPIGTVCESEVDGVPVVEDERVQGMVLCIHTKGAHHG